MEDALAHPYLEAYVRPSHNLVPHTFTLILISIFFSIFILGLVLSPYLSIQPTSNISVISSSTNTQRITRNVMGLFVLIMEQQFLWLPVWRISLPLDLWWSRSVLALFGILLFFFSRVGM